MELMTRQTDADQSTTNICERRHHALTHHREATMRSSPEMPRRKQRIRTFAVLTTTLWLCQTIVLLQLLPPSMASSGRIPPPPPPRPPPKAEQTSSELTGAIGEASLFPKALESKPEKKTPPPPPPPRVVPETPKEEEAKVSEIESTAKVESLEGRSIPPPPPPPPRAITKVEEKKIAEITTETEESRASEVPVAKEEEEDPSKTMSETKPETPIHREEQASGLYQYVQQQQTQQYNAMQHNYYPQQQYHQQQYYHHHHYQQPQQQQQPMRQQGYQQPRRHAQSSSSGSALASTLKGLWGKVEKGLDDLAGLEGTVAGQAQKLVHSAISTASTATRLSPSALRSFAQSGASASDREATSSSLLSRGNRRQRTTPSVSDVPLKPYGQKYQIAREAKEKEAREKDPFQSTATISGNKLVHDIFSSADKSKSIATKGGATSSPYGYPQNPQQPPSSPSLPGGSTNGDKESGKADVTGDLPEVSFQNPESNPNADPRSIGASWDAQNSSGEMEQENRDPSSPLKDSFGGRNTPHSDDNWGHRPPPSGSLYPHRDPRDSGVPNRGGPAHQPNRPQPRREPPQDPNGHSRSSRIPWDDTKSPPNRQAPPNQQNRPSRPSQDSRFDDDEKPSWKSALKGFSLPPLPSFGKLKLPRFRRRRNNAYYSNLDAWDSEDDGKKGGFFGFFKKSSSSSTSTSSNILSRNAKQDANDGQPALVASMISRCNNGKSVSLLSSNDTKASKLIGRYKAVLDVMFLVSVLLGFKLLSGFYGSFELPSSWQDFLATAMPMVGSVVNELAVGSWALFAFLYAGLFKYYRDNVLDHKMKKLASTVSSSVKEESEYSQLYLRLLAAIPMDRNLPDRLALISKLEVASLVAKSRLNAFVGIVLSSLTVMTVSAVGPFVMAIVSAMTKIVFLKELRTWPVQWEGLFGAASAVMQNLFHSLESQGASALRSLIDNPIQFSFHISMFFSLFVCTLLPGIEERRAVAAKAKEEEDEDAGISNFDSAEEWSRLGTSSASRLSMLSENGSVESALAHWRAGRVSTQDDTNSFGSSVSSILRLVGYGWLAAILAVSPLVVSHLVAGETPALSNALSIFRWDSLFDLSFLQVLLFGLVWQTLLKVMASGNDASVVKEFQAGLVSTQEEVEESNKSNAAFHAMGSVNPNAGIAVRDLWSAHATKRSWAIRGANFHCKNGEILAVLGEDGNGKTRLLTTVAESLIFPPKRTATTNKVRGLIAIGGLDVAKWDRKMLKRRLGVFLSDVRMVADSASLFSGWTMEEILEPVDGLRSSNGDPMHRTYTKAEKSAMILALKITGLYKSLLARLPSKTSTIFTANEEDLRPTSLKPRSTVLSPGEWSKLMLARVLAQTIFDNDNSLASDDKIENSLMGSILLLDEPTTMHSEIDEGQLYKDLRKTGAATVISTNKWATGRFADHIVVVKNGSIVEMGTHNELLARGPQQSLYAAKWHAMTIQ